MKKQITRTFYTAFVMLTVMFGGVNIVSAHPKTVRITVTDSGFSQTRIRAEEGSPLTLIFTRTTKAACGNKVTFPSLNISRNLPVGKPVTIQFSPRQSGEISFTCGMGMMKGTIVVQEDH
jgi:plastocyanin domain-containing protein